MQRFDQNLVVVFDSYMFTNNIEVISDVSRHLEIQESLAKAKVSARQQCVYEDQFCHLTVV